MQVAGRAIAAVLLLCGGAAAVFAQELSVRQPDGKVVTVIDDKGVGGPLLQYLERRNPDGSLDLAFGQNGRALFSLKTADILEPRSLSLDEQGRLVLSGTADRTAAAAVSRFLPDGRADVRWGKQGTSVVRSRTGIAQAVDALAMPDQGVLMLGRHEASGRPDVVLWRLRFDGTLDAGFGRGGMLRLASLDGAQPNSLRHDADGSVLIGSQREQLGGLSLEAHRWQPDRDELVLVARQDAPPGWRGPAILERREGRWQWFDAVAAGALPLIVIGDPASPAASMGRASFNPFAPPEVSGDPAAVAYAAGSAPMRFAMVLALMLAAWAVVQWRRRGSRAMDLGPMLDPRAVGADAVLRELAGNPLSPVGGSAARRGTATPSPAPPAAIRNGLERPLFGPPDDLKRIKGIGPVLERRLREEGIFYFWQIAQWRPEDVADVGARLSGFRGRIERDRWVTQAVELST